MSLSILTIEYTFPISQVILSVSFEDMPSTVNELITLENCCNYTSLMPTIFPNRFHISVPHIYYQNVYTFKLAGNRCVSTIKKGFPNPLWKRTPIVFSTMNFVHKYYFCGLISNGRTSGRNPDVIIS